jgi:hypothetical protein
MGAAAPVASIVLFAAEPEKEMQRTSAAVDVRRELGSAPLLWRPGARVSWAGVYRVSWMEIAVDGRQPNVRLGRKERRKSGGRGGAVKFTKYFEAMSQRPDRASIRLEWIEQVVARPMREEVQGDGRIRRWAAIEAADGRYLRVILLADGETVHHAFFDRSFRP